MPSPEKKYRSDRCVNPFNMDKGHSKYLRKISKTIQEAHPEYPHYVVICDTCRQSFDRSDDSSSANVSMIVDCQSDTNLPSVPNTDALMEDDFTDPSVSNMDALTQDDLTEILSGLKKKLQSLSQNDPLRVSILTILPEHWSIRKISDQFGVSYRMARKAKELRKLNGVLASPVAKSGKTLPAETTQKVKDFYENDLNSRIMANKKSTVSVYIDDEKRKMQKRLLLTDIKNLHDQFKEQFPEHPIGLTKFAELRPEWCVIAGSSGTHTVCVCTIHENFEQMIDAVNIEKISNGVLKNYKDCLNFVLCNDPKPSCYLNECKFCPDIQKFSDYVENCMDKYNIDEVIFSTWQSTDRCTLIKQCLTSQEFIETLCSKLEKLIPHHFIAKEQSQFTSEKKNNLSDQEVLVHLDFSENYPFVAQNAAQAFHFNNDQSTIFPAVVYYKCKGELRHFSTVAMSDCTTHDATAVYIMQQKLIPEIRKVCPKVKKVIYASDGAKQHFKNRFQMSNLMSHKRDFGVDAEWHCFATAHGKGSCDGVGAIVKREATRASLQAAQNEAILDVEALYSWANKRSFDIKFFLYTKNDHDQTREFLTKRFNNCPAVTNIQMCHGFIPQNDETLKVMQYSNAKKPKNKVPYDPRESHLSPVEAPRTRSRKFQ